MKLHIQTTGTDFINLEVYREDHQVNNANDLSVVPYAVIAPTDIVYEDTTYLPDVRYHYYLLGVKADGTKTSLMSKSVCLEAISPGKEPGSRIPLVGDYCTGYFGTVPFTDIVDVAAFRANYNLPASWINVAKPGTFHKFRSNGDTYYMLETPMFYRMTWGEIYHAGLMFGSPGDCLDRVHSTVRTTLTATDQNKLYTKDGFTFSVSAPLIGDGLFKPTLNALQSYMHLPSVFLDQFEPMFKINSAVQVRPYQRRRTGDLITAVWMPTSNQAISAFTQVTVPNGSAIIGDANSPSLLREMTITGLGDPYAYYGVFKLIRQ